MAILKPFKGIRPTKENVLKVASKPYDVLDEKEARKEAEGNPISFYHVIKPEIDFLMSTIIMLLKFTRKEFRISIR
jgi:uncharacterized protein (DUF1015 family)